MKLSALISDGMVLQRGQKVNIWGMSEYCHEVTIHFLKKIYQTKADETGKWEAVLEDLQPGGPFEMELFDGEKTIIHDIMVGDVWILGGQSNMELPVSRTLDLYAKEVAGVKESHIRMFAVPQLYDFHAPQEDIFTGRWVSVTPEDVMNFSAIGYFFAKELYESHGVPIGLLQTAVGGTPAQAWISEPTLLELGGYEDELEKCKDDNYVRKTMEYEADRNNEWYRDLYEHDLGMKDMKWFQEDIDISEWSDISVPGIWNNTELETVRGSVWLRKEFILSEDIFHELQLIKEESLAGHIVKKIKLVLGTLVDADDTYVNGVFVGNMGYMYPPRRYIIPEGVLRSGKNTITIRLISNQNIGGFVPDKPYQVIIGEHIIDLTGSWKYQVGAYANPLESTTFFQYKPSGVYNGMIYPIRRYSIKGTAFYQGESNTGNPKGYLQLFTALIKDWRKLWNQGDFPFLYVQLANFGNGKKSLTDSGWAEIREEQRKSLQIKNTGMVVTIDVGEYNDLHPLNKKTVAHRLAFLVENNIYGERITSSGPIYERKLCTSDNIRLYFNHTGKGLVAKNGDLKLFTICGENGNFVPATAVIEEDTVIVSSSEVQYPKHVRYGWEDNPENGNLYNQEGLPASPFSTQLSILHPNQI